MAGTRTLAVAAAVLTAGVVGFPGPFLRIVDGVLCGIGGSVGVEMVCYPFVQRALVGALAIGVVAPLVGTFLVYRQMALVGDALAHTAFAGAAIGLLVGSATALPVSPTAVALVVAVVAAIGIEWLTEHTEATGDVSMAVVLTGGFALGTVVVSLTDGGLSVGIKQYLFGSLVTVTRADVRLLVGLSGGVLAAVAFTYPRLVAVTIDETAARVGGLDVRAYNRLLLVLSAVVVVAAMQILGVILVIAMLVVPVATARPLSRGFTHGVVVAVLFAEAAIVGGITVAYYAGVAVGGTIVLLAIGVYLAVLSRPRPDVAASDRVTANR